MATEARIQEIRQKCQEGTLLPSDLGLPEHFRRYHDILDAQFERLYAEHQNLFPAWWREALEP